MRRCSGEPAAPAVQSVAGSAALARHLFPRHADPPPRALRTRRALLQLQADNTELQAEIQHLAATLRAALASSPEAGQAGCLDGEPSFQHAAQHHPDLQHILQDLGQHQHSHAHLATGTPACSGGGDSGAHFDVATGAAGAPPVYHQPTEVSQATLSCSMQHPGSICCSKLSAAVDPEGASCAVSLHTTARCTADGATVHRHLSPEELRALAAHALVSAAHSFSQQAAAEYRAKGGPQQVGGGCTANDCGCVTALRTAGGAARPQPKCLPLGSPALNRRNHSSCRCAGCGVAARRAGAGAGPGAGGQRRAHASLPV